MMRILVTLTTILIVLLLHTAGVSTSVGDRIGEYCLHFLMDNEQSYKNRQEVESSFWLFSEEVSISTYVRSVCHQEVASVILIIIDIKNCLRKKKKFFFPG
jgi:hypothetical protein